MKNKITKYFLLVCLVLFCISCASIEPNRTISGEPTTFGPVQEEKPSWLRRTWNKMNPLYNSEWSTGKKVAYVISPLGH